MKTIMATVFGAFTLLALLPAAPSARADAGDEGKASGDRVPVKRLTFSDDDIAGDRVAPAGTLIHGVRQASQASLIELRRGFEAEIAKMIEDL